MFGLSRRTVTLIGVLGGTFLAAIEGTIVATAMPTVVEQLGGLAHYSWAFSAYLVTATITGPLWGRLSDLYGRRPFYLGSVFLFLLGSALSGASQSMPQLIVFRAVQGFGAGGLIPLGLTIIAEQYTLRERARTQALLSSVWGVASIVGPVVGGYVTQALSWRWIFYLNLPFGLVAAVLVGTALEEHREAGGVGIDYRGVALMSASIGIFMLALGQTGTPDRTLAVGTVVLLYVVAVVLGAAFFWIEGRAAQPIVPMDLFANRMVSTVALCGFLVGIPLFGIISFVPLFVQAALGGTATQAGAALTPLLLGWVGMAVVTGRLLPRVGYRPFIIGGLAFICCGVGGLATIERGDSRVLLYGSLAIMGIGLGMTMLSQLLALQGAVPRDRLGVVTSLGQFSRSIGGAVGVAAMGTVVAASLPSPHALGPAEIELGLHNAFVFGTVMSVVALLVSLRVPPGHAVGTHARAA
jgi:EmrB/QacA subfamily drug resistance transporter